THPDHWMTNCLFIEAAQQASLPPTVMCWGYETWAPVVANAVVDITEAIEIKKQAMDAFASQIEPYNYPRLALGLNTYRAILNQGRGYAEAFYVAEFALYCELYKAGVIGHQRV